VAARVATQGNPDAVALCGLADAPAQPELTVVLGEVRAGEVPDSPWLLWCEGRPGEHVASPPARLLAQDGEGLWRRAPWPVADAIFDLELPADPAVAVAVEDEKRRTRLVDRLTSDGAKTFECERLTPSVLRQSSVVIAASASASLFPARAFAAAAARRVLVLDELPVSFGLLPGRDHVQARDDDEVCQAAMSVVRHPRAFHWMRSLGTIAAERQRSSLVYARLVTDLRLEGRDR
jgi:hypothetical protein